MGKQSVVLACTWQPYGELPRLRQLAPFLKGIYSRMVVSLPPTAGVAETAWLRSEPWAVSVADGEWASGVYAAVERSLGLSYEHLHYADLDRLLRWAETRPDELGQTVQAIREVDCLILGRTEAANLTHPRSMQETERLANVVASHFLGYPADVCAGSRGFSRRAVEHLMARSRPGRWKDAEWPLLLSRDGFQVEYRAVDGLDWETADRYREQAADPDTQRRQAEEYDQDPANWSIRVAVAQGIIDEALAALQQH